MRLPPFNMSAYMWESCVENEEITKKKKTIRKVKDINIYALTEN